MPDPSENRKIADSTLDLRLGEILDEYLQQVEKGTAVSREEFLRQHHQLADRLAACLDGVELFEAGNLGRANSTGDRNDAAQFDATQNLANHNGTTSNPPQTIGDYEIRNEIGRGGMGVVYEAREKSLDRVVALKIMRFGIVDPRALERFQREAETAGALHHTNIVPVYATGREGDTSWYAMQLIEGESLAQRIHDAYPQEHPKPISADEIVDIGLQAAEALEHAHQRDIVHRDVKPANLIIDTEGRVWLTDFGLARRLVDVGATMTGALLGTPRYMSPEQADLARVDVDHRSDIYSLGATLYELATGRPPFEGDDPLQVISQIRYEDPPSPKSVRPGISRDLDVVLMKCLAKESNRRYSTAAELAEDLRAIRDDRPICARQTSLTEHAVRWARKHQGRVRAACLTAMATVALVMLASMGLENYRETTRGSFRLSAAGGPYVTSIHPVGSSNGSQARKQPINLTVPMQDRQKLKLGDYDVTLAPRGRWSEKVRLPIRPGIPSEYRLRNLQNAAREISIAGAYAVPTSGYDGPAVIWSRDGRLKRYCYNADNDWTLDATNVQATVVSLLPSNLLASNENAEEEESAVENALNAGDSSQVAESTVEKNSDEQAAPTETNPNEMSIDFTISPAPHEANWLRTAFHQRPQYASPRRALNTAIDLDSDARADSVIAAMNKSALLAVDADGKVLWAKAYDINGQLFAGNPSTMRQPIKHLLPGIVEIIDVGDRNADGVPDLAVQMVHIQPGIQNDVCVALISGKNGDPMAYAHPPALKLTSATPWPREALLGFHTGQEQRHSGKLRFSSTGARRSSSSHWQHTPTWRSSGTARFALPSPMQVIRTQPDATRSNGRLIAVHHAGRQCVCIDLESGEQLGPPINLPADCAGAPRIVHFGESSYGLVFHEEKPSNHTIVGRVGPIHATRFVAYELSGKLLWEHFVDSDRADWSATTGYASQTDWPQIGDANGDGQDELLVPGESTRWSGHLGIEMLDARTGKLLWQPRDIPQILHTAERSPDRLALSSDIDGDGWRDWVVASIAGPPAAANIIADTDIGEANVYVDWISGKTGHAINWSKHPISTVPRRIGYAEIDAIRTNILGGERGFVEIDLVNGEKYDSELDSATIRFHPSSSSPVSIASGVTVCATPTSWQTASISKPSVAQMPASARVYYLRPGPFLDGDERLVFLDEKEPIVTRVGESNILATWQEPDGRTLAALTGFDPERLTVIDVEQQTTLWSTKPEETDIPAYRPIQRPNGSYDFLAQQPKYHSAPVLLDGATGRPIWNTPHQFGGKLKYAQTMNTADAPERMLLIGDGQNYRLEESSDVFTMSVANSADGRVLWSTRFLHGAARLNTPQDLDDIQLFDANDDGHLDIIGPDQLEGEETLRIRAWNGLTGDVLWTKDLNRNGANGKYFAGHCTTLRIDGKPRLAMIRPALGEEVNHADARLVIFDAATGKALCERSLPGYGNMLQVRRSSSGRCGAIAVCSTTDQARIEIVGRTKAVFSSTLFNVSDSDITEVSTSVNGGRWQTQQAWLKNVMGDPLPERLFLQQDAFVCIDVESNETLWRIPLPKVQAPRTRSIHWEQHHNLARIVDHSVRAGVAGDPDSVLLIDLALGKIVQRLELQPHHSRHDSRVAARDGDKCTLLVSTPSGTQVRTCFLDTTKFIVEESNESNAENGVANANASGDSSPDVTQASVVSESISLHSERDPRRTRKLKISQHDKPISSVIFNGLRSAFGLVIFTLPFFYVASLIFSRQWSLSWFLMAPLVLVLVLLVVRSSWFGIMTVIDGFRWLATPVGLYLLIWPPQSSSRFAKPIWPHFRGATQWYFLATLFVISLVSIVFIERTNMPSTMHYVITSRDVLFVLVSAASYAIRWQVGMLFIYYLIQWHSSRQRPMSNATEHQVSANA